MLSSGSPVSLSGNRQNNLLNTKSRSTVSINYNNIINMQPSNSFMAYGERPQLGLDVEYGTDPASGAIFKFEGRKHDDLKQMLDSNKDGLKLEAMKRIISMIARGRDASDLFPAVVKNVVSKNIEVKKLVYVYLVRYAEEQQDLALLSISTFQRALKDPNQLIRASALRVLSSIRVNMIVPIVMLAIRDSASDMSPYVRKTAAHAIPKLYSLDAEQKDELVTVIEKLLSDRTTLVVGSAVMAFEEVCPERVDLIHKNYHKLCNLLVDVDEWGQVIIINMLTRYARTQFVNPNLDEFSEDDGGKAPNYNENKFYEDDNADDVDGSTKSDSTNGSSSGRGATKNKVQKNKQKKKKKTMSIQLPKTPVSGCSNYHVDLDHRLLLRQTKPLLQSRNASVVMAVAQLYHHVAPRQEVQIIGKALIRLLRSHKEVQSVVLTCIASISTKRKVIFETHIKSFFVRTSDPTHIKLLKLEVLTNLASGRTISLILREFQTYIMNTDRSFVAATIQAIGRCAASIIEVTETCLNGLVHLLSHREEYIVAESVVVIKKLLQTKDAQHYEIIIQMAKLLDYVKVPAARAAITWLIGEYNEKVNKIAPDVLRKLAKSFVDEENSVKLQILNLAVKLYLTNPQQTSLLGQYVFSLARYDLNYDVRDRARFLKQFIFPVNNKTSILYDMAKKVFLADKPAPTLESNYYNRNHYQLGSLSHYLNVRCNGYNDLPDFPIEPSDPSVRKVDGFMPEQSMHIMSLSPTTKNTTENPHKTQIEKRVQKRVKKEGGEDKKQEEPKSTDNLTESDTSPSTSDTSTNESNSDSSNSSSDKDTDNDDNSQSSLHTKMATKVKTTKMSNKSLENHEPNSTFDDDTSSYYTSGTSDTSSTSPPTTDNENVKKNHDEIGKLNLQKSEENVKLENNSRKNLDLLLDLDDIPPMGPVMTPSLGGFLKTGTPLTPQIQQSIQLQIGGDVLTHDLVGPSYINYEYKELINKVQGHGLQISYRYTRSPHLYSSAMVSIELQFVNYSGNILRNIRMGKTSLGSGMEMQEFPRIHQLNPGQCLTSIMGVNFNDSTHAIQFEIMTNDIDNSSNTSNISRRIHFKPMVGELIRAIKISETIFKEERTKLRGMNEHQSEIMIKPENKYKVLDNVFLKQKIFEIINVTCIGPSPDSTNKTIDTEKVLFFVGQTMSSKSWILITCTWLMEISKNNHDEDTPISLRVQVNCEKMVIGSMVLNELVNSLKLVF